MTSEDNEIFLNLVRKHSLVVNALNEKQLAEAIRQALACGDFQLNILPIPRVLEIDNLYNGDQHLPPVYLSMTRASEVVYIPYREHEQLKARIKTLEEELERTYQKLEEATEPNHTP